MTVGLLVGAINVALAMDEPFNPLRKLDTWYTDRSLIDIEVIGSTSLVPAFHRLEPERVLRFRLERAYVHTLFTEREPGFEIVNLGFDTETGLAESLFFAATLPGRFHEDIPAVPAVSDFNRFQRTLLISIKSNLSAASLQHASNVIASCRGALLANELLAYEWEGRGKNCDRPSYPKGSKYVAVYDDDLLLKIECHEEDFWGLGCTVRIPFEGFGPQVTFHRSNLPKWRQVVDRASAFLKSKLYH